MGRSRGGLTTKIHRICDTLGRPLHHDPNPGGAGETARHRAQYRETLAHYARVFGAPPPADLWPDVWPLVAFTAVVMTIALVFYRRTLD